MNSSSHRSRPPRRRAAVACLACRKRKVRCDVARCGVPCSNCRLDDEECSVSSNRGHLRSIANALYIGKATSVGNAPEPSHEQDLGSLPDFQEDPVDLSAPPVPDISFSYGNCQLQELETLLQQHYEAEQSTPKFDASWTITPPPAPLPHCPPLPQQPSQTPRQQDNHILYTFYPFLRQNDFSTLQPRDFSLLEAEGCLRVPHRAALDDFLRQYFVYIHPLLPLMDETEFWELYDNEGGRDGTVALVLVQAMLFAASHCVSATTIASLGFTSAKKARAEYYRRAKLLYDMSSETTPTYALAQASLLLSFWTPPGRLPTGVTPNTSWLVNATQIAYAHHANLYQQWSKTSQENQHLRLWKRIWWCCIIRDRSMSLGLRRAPQITRHSFDFQNSDPLSWDDLYPSGQQTDCSANKPRFFSEEGSKKLAGLLQNLMSLCALLTGFQQFSQHFQSPVPMEDQSLVHLDELRAIKTSLQDWRIGATETFNTDHHSFPSVDEATAAAGGSTDLEAPVFLHAHIVQIYYYSATLALSHYELLLVLMAFPAEDDVYSILRFSYTPRVLQEVKDASSDFAQCLSQLVKPGLAKLLPISMTAFVVMPLIHHLVDLDLSKSSHLSTSAVKSQKQRERLNSMVEALRTLSTNYDGVEWVNNLLKQSLQRNGLSPSSPSFMSPESPEREGSAPAKKGIDDSAIEYLRVAFTAEVSLSRSRLAHGADLPGCLATLFRQKKAVESPDMP